MTALFLLAMALIMLAGVSGLTFQLWRTGSMKWNRQISATAKQIANRGMVLGLALSVFLMGFEVVLSIAPVYAGAWLFVLGSYKILDWLFIRDDGARAIQHADGRRAVVDRDHYRPMPPDERR